MTYLLIVSVLGLWGFIFYRVTDNVSAGPPKVSPPQRKVSDKEEKVFSVKDTFTLLLNYRDPFSGEIVMEPAKEVRESAVNIPKIKPDPLKISHIIYTGYIINPGSKRAVSIITINGKEQMIAEGESIGDVKLLRNRKDSVEVCYKGRNYFINKN